MAVPEPSALQIAAGRYDAMGLSVFPLKPMSKTPDLTSWEPYMKRRPTSAEREGWFSSPRNIAVVCGQVSNLLGLDFDDLKALAYYFPKWRELAKHTPVVSTPRPGAHIWLRIRGGFDKLPRGFKLNGVDVQGERHYLAAPPSVHPNGQPYRFVDEAPAILEVSLEELEALQRKSAWWPLAKELLGHWSEPNRHKYALGLAKLLHERGSLERQAIEEIVRGLCAAAVDAEVEDRLHAIRDTLEKGPHETAARTFLGDELYAKVRPLIPKCKAARREGDGPPDHSYFVDELTGEIAFAALDDTGEILFYREGAYRPKGEAFIAGRVEAAYLLRGVSATRSLVDETVHGIRRRTYTSRDAFNPAGKLCLKNGILDLGSLELLSHASNERFTIQLPIAYDPAATCPRFQQFLEEILPDETARKLVHLLFGYCLEPGNPHQIAFIFVGEGNNGKSTTLGILADLLGPDNVASESLQRLVGNRFASANLYGKLANLCADIPSQALPDTGIFKMLVGGDRVPAERKFQAAFWFINGAKLVFSCNTLPDVTDKSYAFWRRWYLVEFRADFTGREDRELLTRLWAELPGILNYALEGLRILRSERGFPQVTGAASLKEEWKRRADSLYWFVSERIEKDPKADVPKATFYQAYVEFCEERGLRAKAADIVGKELSRHAPYARSERPREGDKRVLVWSGIRLKLISGTPDHPDTPDQNKEGDRASGQGGRTGQGSTDTSAGRAPRNGGPAEPPIEAYAPDQVAAMVLDFIRRYDQGYGVPESVMRRGIGDRIPTEALQAALEALTKADTLKAEAHGEAIFYRATRGGHE